MAYVVVALVFSWPLPLHLSTQLTGDPAGDTGVYVWNQWVFQHELIDHGRNPYYTDTVFASGPRADLSLHNYTTFQNVLAIPFIRPFGVVTAFNIVLLLMHVLTACVTFLLARHVTGRAPEAWLAGLFFAWSPALVTRGMAHFSLVAAAPLACLLLLLLTAEDQLRAIGRIRFWTSLALGGTLWWAASTDVYYAVYCLMLGAAYIVARSVTVERRASAPSRLRGASAGFALASGAFAAAIAVTGGFSITVLGQAVPMYTLYTPILVATVFALAWGASWYRASLVASRRDTWAFARAAAIAGVYAAVLLSPLLYAVGLRLIEGRFEVPPLYWRSSPSGLDLVAMLAPNPNHPLTPAAVAGWFATQRSGYIENVASIPLVGLAVLAIAWRAGWRAPRPWAWLTGLFGLLALGPFVQIAGFNTHVPGPWALLRYVPVIELARSPTRFSVVMTLALAVMLASALSWLGSRQPRRRRWLLVAASALLAFELLPSPRPLYSAAVPGFYRLVAAAADDVGVLELPFGLRDGASSVGNASARSQFFQIAHGKALQGGYLSRVSRQQIADVRKDEVLDALLVLSEGLPLDAAKEHALLDQGRAYVRRARLGFVVVDNVRTPPRLRELAVRAFNLRLVEAEGPFELYAPAD